MIHKTKICLFSFAALLLFACKQNTRPDISQIKLNIQIERFDKDLFERKNQSIALTTAELQKKYGFFYNDYAHIMVGNSELSDSIILSALYQDQAYTDLTQEKDSIFPTLKPYEESLTNSFKYIKHYYPDAPIPRMIAFISGFAYQTPIGEDYIGIGLDMFLGKDSKFYGAIVESVPRYLSRRFTPEYIVPRVIETYTREELFPEPDQYRNLLSKMLYNGKILYFMDQILPEQLPDDIKIGYTPDQLKWCDTYKKEIWGYFLENDYLYETNYQKIQVFLSDGPFTPGVGVHKESAPKLGIWTGWQIIRSYMKNNPEITLQQLMAETDMQAILNKARYKP